MVFSTWTTTFRSKVFYVARKDSMRILLTLFLILLPTLAHASLGLESSSIAPDCQTLKGTLSQPATNQFECTTVSGTVDFFVGSDDLVNRIAWHGRNTPSLSVLLGTYGKEYRAAFAQKPPSSASSRTRRALLHETEHLRVKRSGNGRFHSGEINLKPAN